MHIYLIYLYYFIEVPPNLRKISHLSSARSQKIKGRSQEKKKKIAIKRKRGTKKATKKVTKKKTKKLNNQWMNSSI